MHGDNRFARYLLPFPIVGACVSVYHILIENQVITEPNACQIGGAGCAVKWINYFGYMTIPTLALTGVRAPHRILSPRSRRLDRSAATLAADG